MSTIIERIKELCFQMRISENKLANEIGVNTQTLNNYTTGKRGVSYDVVDKILVRFPQVSAEWLIRGIGTMLNNCGCSSADDESIYHPSSDGTCNGPGTEEEGRKDESEQARFYKEQAEFYKQQAEFYKQQLDSLKGRQ